MLESLHLRNWQKHKSLEVDLGHPIVTIVGPSDRGKSSLLRSIRFCCLNLPSGTSFIRRSPNGRRSRRTRVRLVCDDRVVERTRSLSSNLYRLDGQEFRSFGNLVPEPIAKLFNVSPANFTNQHAATFWFSLSPGQVSRELNAIVQLEVIDNTLAKAAQTVKLCRSRVSLTKTRLEEARQARDRLEGVEALGLQLQEIEGLESEIDEKNLQSERLDALIRAVRVQQQRAAIEIPDLSELDRLEDNLRRLEDRQQLLQGLVTGIATHTSRIASCEHKRAEAESLLAKQIGKICPLCGQTVETILSS